MISVDDPDTNKKFAEQEQADFPMLSDPAKTVADAYGVLPPVNPANPDAPRYARRWTFYIGPDGKILFIDRAVKAATAGDDLAAKLTELGVKKKK
jgi:peroxiredoxin Q/BCP